EPALFAKRPVVAIAGDAGIDEARVDLFQARIVDAEPRRHGGPKILDQHIGLLDHAVQRRQPFLLFEVEADRELAAIGADKEPAVGPRQARRKLAQLVALRRLDLDHRRAEIGEQRAAVRPRQIAAQIEDRDAAERTLWLWLGHFAAPI